MRESRITPSTCKRRQLKMRALAGIIVSAFCLAICAVGVMSLQLGPGADRVTQLDASDGRRAQEEQAVAGQSADAAPSDASVQAKRTGDADGDAVAPSGGGQGNSASAASTNCGSDEGDSEPYVPGEVLVVLDPSASASDVNARLATTDFLQTKQISDDDVANGFALLTLAEGVKVEEAAERLSSESSLAYVQPNFRYEVQEEAPTPAANTMAAGIPVLEVQHETNDPATQNPSSSEYQWALDAMHVREAWDRVFEDCENDDAAAMSNSVGVAVIDEGFDSQHEDLKGIVEDQVDAAAEPQAVTVTDSAAFSSTRYRNHGTHVAGIVGAEIHNGKGVAGVSHNAKLTLVKIADEDGSATTTTMLKAYKYLKEKKSIRVINMSMGVSSLGGDDKAIHDAIKDAYNNGVVTVCSAGNDADKLISVSGQEGLKPQGPHANFPSDYEETVGVINVSKSGNAFVKSKSSNYNREGETTKNISAPGSDIYSCSGSDSTSYVLDSGTSMAAPQVAGVFALIFAANPNLTAQQAVKILYETAADLNTEENINGTFDLKTGWGLANADAAVRVARGAGKIDGADSLLVGKSTQMVAFRLDDLKAEWTWSTSDGGVATVTPDGVVTGVGVGHATITATSGDISFEHELDVYDLSIAAVDSFPEGGTAQLKLEGGQSSTWVWSASDPAALSVKAGQDSTTCEVTGLAAGRTKVRATLSTNKAVYAEVAVNVSGGDITQATIEPIDVQDYTGAEVVPSLKVTYKGRTLEKDVDYTAACANNVEIGTATVTVTGINNFQGEGNVSGKFEIRRVLSEKTTVQMSDEPLVYDGNEKAPKSIAVFHDSKELVEGTDYALSISNNVNAGEGAITVEGKGDYYGSKEFPFTILPVSLSDASMTLDATSYTYDGEEKKPGVTVKRGATVLKAGVDYEVVYASNEDVGTAMVSVVGMGNYKDSLFKEFTIARAPLSSLKVELSATKYTYDGKAKKPTVIVDCDFDYLELGDDYEVAYARNVNAGTAVVTLTGKGNYTGVVTKTFTIAKAEQPLRVKAKHRTVRYAKLKKAKRKVARPLKVSGAEGAVTYKKVAGSAKISVKAKTGKVKVAKGIKRGRYVLKIRVTAKATANYGPARKTVKTVINVK